MPTEPVDLDQRGSYGGRLRPLTRLGALGEQRAGCVEDLFAPLPGIEEAELRRRL